MAQASATLAASLEILKELQDRGIVAIRARHLTRTHRERLLKNGFIREVMKGWYIATRPDEPAGESTAWYASFWAFCAEYLSQRFDDAWCLSPEQSLGIHAGDESIPRQVLVRAPKGGNKPIPLPHETSIFDIRLELPPAQDIETKDGINVFCLPAALIAIPPTYFIAHPDPVRAALSAVTDASDLLSRLLSGGHSTIAGRLAGAFRNIGRTEVADDILEAMTAAGYTVNEADPFAHPASLIFSTRETSPYVNRIRTDWQRMREDVMAHFIQPPAQKPNKTAYLKHVDDVYVRDAYNSLSIEGYRVSAQLIERVRSGNWNPERNEVDRDHRDALAARGYWQAFQQVKQTLEKILDGQNAGTVVATDHRAWYRQLFGVSVVAGIIGASELAGYRNHPVYIRHSMHVPPRHEVVRELMPALFDLLINEKEPAVRVVLGHFFFVYIHPYMDGNGRMGRFLMNAMLASGGYPWTVVPLERRNDYMAGLEQARTEKNVVPFTHLIRSLVESEKQ